MKDCVDAIETEQRITDLLIEFDEMGFAPTTVCPDGEQYAIDWRDRVRKEFARLTEQEKQAVETLTRSFTRMETLYKVKCTEIEAKEEEISDLKAENAALRERLEKAVELPCKVGDTVYSVFKFPNEKTVLKGTCKHININICSGFPEIFIKLVFETNEQLFLRTYSGNDLNNIFLLRSEAEARLAEIKGGKE